MARIFFLIALVVVLYIVIKRFSAYLGNSQQPSSKQNSAQSGGENIVQCALCGTHIPESESMQLEAKTVCKQQPCKHQR